MTPDHLLRWRKSLFLTQTQAAILLGYSRVTVNLWEKGHAPIPWQISHTLPALTSTACAGRSATWRTHPHWYTRRSSRKGVKYSRNKECPYYTGADMLAPAIQLRDVVEVFLPPLDTPPIGKLDR